MRWAAQWWRRLRASPKVARTGWWAFRARRSVHEQLRAGGLDAIVVAPPPRSGPGAERALRAVLGRRGVSCLERSAVRQSWMVACGDRRDLVIGVATTGDGFGAHAWLQGDRVDPSLVELIRRAPPHS